MKSSNKKPNKIIAPIVIAGITVGFLASAYKFVFAKPKPTQQKEEQNLQTEDTTKQS